MFCVGGACLDPIDAILAPLRGRQHRFLTIAHAGRHSFVIFVSLERNDRIGARSGLALRGPAQLCSIGPGPVVSSPIWSVPTRLPTDLRSPDLPPMAVDSKYCRAPEFWSRYLVFGVQVMAETLTPKSASPVEGSTFNRSARCARTE